ncbi:endonuclease domain-containing protein [Micromonospora sp. NPDC049679]|uniref:endonuclease domain-containing protein n=1 Tax=Micromonospora sp. NPDC049679 TaxID=3155920 RepID=UPI0033E725D3
MPGKSLRGYKMTVTDYLRRLAEQEGLCAICGGCNYYADEPAPLCVDHDHVCCPNRARTCGRCVRGLLCAGCNGFLGELELWGRMPMDVTWHGAARAYLAKYGCDPEAPYRRLVLREQHQLRTATWPRPCRCPLCNKDYPATVIYGRN